MPEVNVDKLNRANAHKFIDEHFLKLLHDKFEEKWPDIWVKSKTTDQEEYNNANGCMYEYYISACNSLFKLPECGKYKRTEEEIINSDYSYIKRMYEDCEKSDIAEFVMTYLPPE